MTLTVSRGQAEFVVPELVGKTRESVEIPLSRSNRFDQVVGRSVPMRELFATLEKVAPSDLTVLIEGETGTGKERVSRSIHNMSRRKGKPDVVLDCSSIPKDLMESLPLRTT